MALYQTYIPCCKYNLFSCIYSGDTYHRVALLLPGYSHSKSDMDYLLSNIRNILLQKNYLVVQLDFYGHGDSCGKFEDCVIPILFENIHSSIEWIKQEFHCDYIDIFGRGIIGNILARLDIGDIRRFILNPVCLFDDDIQRIQHLLTKYSLEGVREYYDDHKLMSTDDKKIMDTFMYSLGIELRNILGMKIDYTTVKAMLEMTSDSSIPSMTECIVSTAVNEIAYYRETICKQPLIVYVNCFLRDPEWNDMIADAIAKRMQGDK